MFDLEAEVRLRRRKKEEVEALDEAVLLLERGKNFLDIIVCPLALPLLVFGCVLICKMYIVFLFPKQSKCGVILCAVSRLNSS